MSDKWYYTHAGATRGPVSGVQLRGLIEIDGLAPGDLIWPDGASPGLAVRADAAMAFPTAAVVEAKDYQPLPPPAPDWLPELDQALAAVQDLTALPPPRPADWIADVRRAETMSRPAAE